VTDQYVGSRHRLAAEQIVQFVRDAADRSWKRTGVAPSEPGAVIRAGTCHASERRLNETPTQRRRPKGGIEDDRRSALPGTSEVEAMSSHVDKTPGWRE
jgi:hypothetical protein